MTITEASGPASNQGATMVADLLSIPPRARDAILAELDASDLAVIMSACRREMGSPYALWRDDPVGFVRDVLGYHTWSGERRILESLRDHRRTAVHACYESGKTFTAGNAVAWWLSVWPPKSAACMTTATSGAQVKALLWKEIGRAHDRGQLPGRLNLTEWWYDREVVGMGRKPAEYNATAIQGLHAERVLGVIDEATGVPAPIWEAMDGLVANDESRMLTIGNPTDPSSFFASVCRPASGYNVVHISAFDTPNFTAEGANLPPEVLRSLVGRTWVEEKRQTWGEQSPLWIARVEGLFPEDSTDRVVPLGWLKQRALITDEQLAVRRFAGDDLLPVELGCDVGEGSDRTVVRERRGMLAGREWIEYTRDPEKCVELLLRCCREVRPTRVKIDAIGIGWGMVGFLRSKLRAEDDPHLQRCVVEPIKVSESAAQPKKYKRLRDEMWWEVGRELTRTQAWVIPDDDDLANELTAPTYSIAPGGQIVVESKDDLRKRLGVSPDRADALLLAFVVRAKPASGNVAALTSLQLPS